MRHLEARKKRVEETERSLRLVRAGIFIAAAIVSFMASRAGAESFWSVLAGAVWLVFLVAIVIHQKLRRKMARLDWRLRLEGQLNGMRRLERSAELSWDLPELNSSEALGSPSAKRLMRDLDLGSPHGFVALFPFFLSRAGQARFLELLTAPVASVAEVLRRQRAIQFWEERVVQRRKILRVASTLEERLDPKALSKLAHTAMTQETGYRLLFLVVIVQIAFFALWALSLTVLPKIVGTLALLTWLGTYAFVIKRVDLFAAYPKAMLLGRGLRVLREVSVILARVATIPGAGVAQIEAFSGDHNPARHLDEIEKTAGAMGVRQNPLLALVINFVIPWDLYWALRFEQARRGVASSLDSWFGALAEVESFLVFAEWNSAHGDATPKVAEGDARGEVFLEAKRLAHPLLSPAKRVANDIVMQRGRSCHLVTGSNMAGKSTFLRALGLNTLLALAGAKVTAQFFELSLLRVESSMRPSDSLSDGFSSFYAEVADLVEITKQAASGAKPATFYLIDEIFRGTNNRERRIGAEAVIRSLAATSAIGLVTTHDLDLASLESNVAGLKNHHFRDDVENGIMTFSYEYRQGPCPSTNALKVMRGAGLQVDPI